MALIEFKNISKNYGIKTILKNVSFSISEGQCVGLIGGSGTGKSVTLRSLIGLEKPNLGEIFFEDKNIVNLNEDELIEVRKKIAYVFQNGALFDSMTVYENLAYPLREHTKLNEKQISAKIHEKLSEFGLLGNEKVYPSNLSGGMQKRLGLARAIIIDPKVILYDEPTAGLDPYNTKRIQEMILRLKKTGTTSILVTHDMPSAFAVCDRILMLFKGEIIDAGTRDKLDTSNESVIHKFIKGDEV